MIELTPNTPEDLFAGAQRLVEQDVDIILSITTPASVAAKRATANTDIPVVFADINDLVGAGLAKSISSPGGNMTGVRIGGFLEKEVFWLITIGDNTETIYAPCNNQDASAILSRLELIDFAAVHGLTFYTPLVSNPADVLASLDKIPEKVDAILILADGMLGAEATTIAQKGIELGLPTAGFDQQHAEQGILVSYGVNRSTVGAQAARIAYEILSEIPPSDLPIETAEFFLSVNLATANASGITVSNETLRQITGTVARPE